MIVLAVWVVPFAVIFGFLEFVVLPGRAPARAHRLGARARGRCGRAIEPKDVISLPRLCGGAFLDLSMAR